MPGVEEERQQGDGRPGESAHDVPDRCELGGAAERDQAHRHRLDRREVTDRAGRQAIDEPEPHCADDDPEAVDDQAAAGGAQDVGPDPWVDRLRPRGRAQRRKVFAQVPSHTTNKACFSVA